MLKKLQKTAYESPVCHIETLQVESGFMQLSGIDRETATEPSGIQSLTMDSETVYL